MASGENALHSVPGAAVKMCQSPPTESHLTAPKFFVRFVVAICLFRSGALNAAPIDGYKVVAKYLHSTDSYTEGFFYLDGLFYEGTGRSEVRL